MLRIAPETFNFEAQGLYSGIQSKSISIRNYGSQALTWQFTEPNDCNWLSLSQKSGCVPQAESNDVEITVNPEIAGYGARSFQLQVFDANAANNPQSITIYLNVIGPKISTNQSTFNFTANGKSDTTVGAQQLVITNTGLDTLDWHIELPACDWLTVSPLSGQITNGSSTVIITVDPNKGPNYGSNSCSFSIVDVNASNSPKLITVNLQVNGPALYVSPSKLYIYAAKNTTDEGKLEINNSGYDTLHWNIQMPPVRTWLKSVEPLSGDCVHNEIDILTVSVDTNGLDVGQYSAPLFIHSPETNTKSIILYLTVYEPNEIHVPADYPTISAALNAASMGSTIIVHPGVYPGFNVSKGVELTIRSVDPNNPAVVAATIIESRIYISSANTVINGFSIIYNPKYANQSDGIYVFSDAQIKNCRILNFPYSGIYFYGYTSAINPSYVSGCMISNNGSRTSSSGGPSFAGIMIYDNAYIENCIITGNFGAGISMTCMPPGAGGGFYHNQLNIFNSTIADNFSDTSRTAGQGIIANANFYDLKMFLHNSIITNKVGPNDVEVLINSINPAYVNLDIDYSNIKGGIASISAPNNINLVWAEGNIDSDPCFARPGRVFDNNTPEDPNDDLWVEGDYHLKSSAGRWEPNEFIDMDVDGDGFLNLKDLAVLAGEWQKTTAKQTSGSLIWYSYLRADLDKNGKVDVNDLILFCNNYNSSYEMGRWVSDDVNSPCIDAGDPNSDWSGELEPNGSRMNMGAFGGTPQASLSSSTVENDALLNKWE